MTKFSVICIDDEPLALNVLTYYLKQHPKFSLVKTFTDPIHAKSFLEKNKVDLVISDIAMPTFSGIDLVQQHRKNTQFIMVTSYTEYAIASFDLDVIDYLLKPISKDRFERALARFEESVVTTSEEVKSSFFVKDGDAFVKVIISDIDYIEGMKDYVKIVSGNNYYLALKTLKSFETLLAPYHFLRAHKSFIVPLKKAEQFNGHSIIINNHTIPVGGVYRNAIKKFFKSNSL